MADVLFSKYADINALEAETGKILDYFTQVKEGLLDLNRLGLKIDTSKGISELNGLTKQYEQIQQQITKGQRLITEQQSKLDEINQRLSQSTKNVGTAASTAGKGFKDMSDEMSQNIQRQIDLKRRINDTQNDLKKLSEFSRGTGGTNTQIESEIQRLSQQEALLKQQLQETNRFIKNQAQEFNAAEGSLVQMRARLNQMLQAYDSADEAFRSSEGGKAAKKAITDLTAAIYEEEKATQRFQRNVGNYVGSAKIIVDAFERVRAKFEATNREGGTLGPEAQQIRQEYEALDRIVSNPQFLKVSAKIGDITSETRFFTKALADLEQQGQKDTSTYRELQAQLAHLTDLMADTREEVKALSSDTRSFDLFASAVGTAASVFQTGASAAELFAGSNEQVQESIRKLMAIQNVANGVRQIATDLTTRGTAANKAYAYVQGLVKVALDTTATSATRLNAVLKLSTIGLVITALGFLADKLGVFGGAANDAADDANRFADALERINQNAQTADKEIQREQKNLRLRAELNGKTNKELQQMDKETVDKRTAVFDDAISKLYEARDNELAQYATDSDKRKEIDEKYQKQYFALINDRAAIVVEAENKNLQEQIDANKKRKEEDEKRTKERLEDLKKLYETERKAEMDLRNFRLEVAAEEQKRIKEDDTQGDNPRIEAAKLEAKLRQQIVENTLTYELGKEKLTKSQIVLAREKAANEIKTIEITLAKELFDIRKAAFERSEELEKNMQEIRRQRTENIYAEQSDAANKRFNQRAVEIEQGVTKEIELTIQAGKRKGRTNEEIEKDITEIESKAEEDRLQNTIDFYRAQILIIKAFGGDATQAEQALDNAERSLLKGRLKRQQDFLNASKEQHQAYIDSLKNLGNEVVNAFQNVVGGTFDEQKNKIQDQIDVIERVKEADIKRITESGEAEDKKQTRIALIEAKAQADREALQNRQKQLDERKARFDRAFKAADIVGQGIRSVANLQVTNAEVSALLARAIASGNPVLIAAATAAKAFAAAQIPIAVATTAAQLVALLATPIPHYFTGTEWSKEGKATVAEFGPELGVDRSGKKTLWTEPTVANLMGGTRIYDAKETKRIMAANKDWFETSSNKPVYQVKDRSDEVIDELKGIRKKDTKVNITIINNNNVESSAYYQQQMKH